MLPRSLWRAHQQRGTLRRSARLFHLCSGVSRLMSLFDLEHDEAFATRHIGVVDPADTQRMLDAIGFGSLEELLDAAVPESIRDRRPLPLPPAPPEAEVAGGPRGPRGRKPGVLAV